jgi:hypothetical protein
MNMKLRVQKNWILYSIMNLTKHNIPCLGRQDQQRDQGTPWEAGTKGKSQMAQNHTISPKLVGSQKKK